MAPLGRLRRFGERLVSVSYRHLAPVPPTISRFLSSVTPYGLIRPMSMFGAP